MAAESLPIVEKDTLPCANCGPAVEVDVRRSTRKDGVIAAFCRLCGSYLEELPLTDFNLRVLARQRAVANGPVILKFPGPVPTRTTRPQRRGCVKRR